MPFRGFRPSPRMLLAISWVCILTMLCVFSLRLIRIGVDLREDFWVYWQNNHFNSDTDSYFYNGRLLMREAAVIERADLRDQPVTASGPTLTNSGPGLLDSPVDLKLLWQRGQRLRPVYSRLFRGWVATYNDLHKLQTDGEYELDYPPLRSMVIMLWTWKVQAQYPGIFEFPKKQVIYVNPSTHQRQLLGADILRPLLILNTIADGVSAIAMFLLVWIWSRRESESLAVENNWRSRWGDPLLLIPPISLCLLTVLRPYIRFDATGFDEPSTPIDVRITSIGWWVFVVLRFVSVVALARILPRPFRGVVCGVVAATLVWINPASILDSIGWPQWEVWLLPFFLIAAVLVTINWWLTAGVVLAVGGMFKGQLFFVAPVLILCPLFAGWFGRFMRIVTGIAAGAALVVWPWLVTNSSTTAYLVATVFASALVCGISILRRPVGLEIRRLSGIARSRFLPRWDKTLAITTDPPPPAAAEIRWPIWVAVSVVMITAAILPMLLYGHQNASYHKFTLLLTLAILLVPWFIPRRMITVWLTLVFACSIWLAAFSLGGSFSWWQIGFSYGTQKHQSMQLGFESLSNLASILERRYNWGLHDVVGTLHLPLVSTAIDLDVQSSLGLLYAISLVLCTVSASIHLRRNDKKFLVALVAPWMLFVTLLTQMTARYTVFPAVLAAALISVSTSLSLFQLLLMVLSCVMVGNQMLSLYPATAPMLYAITRHTFPDMGWLTLALAVILLILAMTPSRRGVRPELSLVCLDDEPAQFQQQK